MGSGGIIVDFLPWWWMLPFHSTRKCIGEGQRGFGRNMKEACLPPICERRALHGGAALAGGVSRWQKGEGLGKKVRAGSFRG